MYTEQTNTSMHGALKYLSAGHLCSPPLLFSQHIQHVYRTHHAYSTHVALSTCTLYNVHVPLSRQFALYPTDLLTRFFSSSMTISPMPPITLQKSRYPHLREICIFQQYLRPPYKNHGTPTYAGNQFGKYPQCIRSPYKHHTTYRHKVAAEEAHMAPAVRR